MHLANRYSYLNDNKRKNEKKYKTYKTIKKLHNEQSPKTSPPYLIITATIFIRFHGYISETIF